ncbi:LysR family transcriptional regulator [Caproiciproducens faecalis]|nr:LysR family transcriptional regulator [Caproiciproducens faecalis]
MKIFLTVSQENSVTKAAEKLHLSQPAVSVAIRELEDYYGVALFERLSRRLYITEAGKRLFDYALHIVSLFEEMETTIKNWDTKGKLRIGTSITIGNLVIPKLVRQFEDFYPQIDVFVAVDSSEEVEEKILRNEVDFGLIEGNVHYENIEFEPFCTDDLVVVCSKEHPLAKKKLVRMQDLKDYPFLSRERNSGTRELSEHILHQNSYLMTPAWESTSTQAIVNALAEGLGFSVLPQKLLPSYQNHQKLRRLNVEGLSFQRQFMIIYHRNKFLTPAAKKFIDLCKKWGENNQESWNREKLPEF